jgi:hypothetical protein
MARLFGASDKPTIPWNFSGGVIGEVSRMMPECTVQKPMVVGIDIGSLYAVCGPAWCENLCRKLGNDSSLCCYFYSVTPYGKALSRWTAEYRFRSFTQPGVQRGCALMANSRCFITADTSLFKAAQLLGIPVVGLFAPDAINRYCSESATTRGIAWTARPSGIPVDAVIQAVISSTDGRITP